MYAGKVGTGFDAKTLLDLRKKLSAKEVQSSPFAGEVSAGRGVHWVRPELVAQVAFTEWTHGDRLRHPRFLGIRRDKPAREVVRESTT
jgi:bifunctional non-homologous end joining protein LigD